MQLLSWRCNLGLLQEHGEQLQVTGVSAAPQAWHSHGQQLGEHSWCWHCWQR